MLPLPLSVAIPSDKSYRPVIDPAVQIIIVDSNGKDVLLSEFDYSRPDGVRPELLIFPTFNMSSTRPADTLAVQIRFVNVVDFPYQ